MRVNSDFGSDVLCVNQPFFRRTCIGLAVSAGSVLILWLGLRESSYVLTTSMESVLMLGWCLVGAIFVAAGLCLMLFRSGVILDRQRETATKWWGFVVPFSRRQTTLNTYDHVVLEEVVLSQSHGRYPWWGSMPVNTWLRKLRLASITGTRWGPVYLAVLEGESARLELGSSISAIRAASAAQRAAKFLAYPFDDRRSAGKTLGTEEDGVFGTTTTAKKLLRLSLILLVAGAVVLFPAEVVVEILNPGPFGTVFEEHDGQYIVRTRGLGSEVVATLPEETYRQMYIWQGVGRVGMVLFGSGMMLYILSRLLLMRKSLPVAKKVS